MAEFDDLQHLWQQQRDPHPPQDDGAALKGAFRRYGVRNNLIYLGKAVVMAFLLLTLVSLLRHRPLAAFGACLAVFSGAYFLISDWRTQRAISCLNFSSPSVEFLRTAIAQLEAQRDPFRTHEFRTGWVGFWAGLVLMFADAWHLLTPAQAVVGVAIMIAAPFGGYAQAVRIRRQRFEKECRPLIDRLQSLLQTMETDRV